MIRAIKNYYREGTDLYCELVENTQTRELMLVYYRDEGNSDDLLITEYFKGKSMHYVEDAAENWALRIREVEGVDEATV